MTAFADALDKVVAASAPAQPAPPAAEKPPVAAPITPQPLVAPVATDSKPRGSGYSWIAAATLVAAILAISVYFFGPWSRQRAEQKPAANPVVQKDPEKPTEHSVTAANEDAAIKLVRINPGQFHMGSPDGEGNPDEHPAGDVTITRPFFL